MPTKSSIPLSAFDPRLIQFWRKGTVTPTIVAEVPEGLRTTSYQDYRTFTGRLRKLVHTLHDFRNAAKREKHPEWESFYSAVVRYDHDDQMYVTRVRIEPRSMALDGILAPVDAQPPGQTAQVPEALTPFDGDILADIFGPLPDDAEKTA